MKRHQNAVFLPGLALLIISFSVEVETRIEPEVPYWCNVASLKCQTECPAGRQVMNGCPTCLCRNDLCVQRGCLENERCTVVRRKSMYKVFGDIAVCEPYAAPAPLTILPNSIRAAENLGTCDFQGRCDATGICPGNSECRKDGRCCKVFSEDDVNSLTNSKTPRCLQEPRVGHCRALGTQFVYNVTTGKCAEMIFGGCVASGNSFATIGECEEVCEHPCQKPRTTGRCRASITRYYFNEYTGRCEAFEYGGCLGNGNNFMSAGECETHCRGLKNRRINTRAEIPVRTLVQPTTKNPSSGNVANDAREIIQGNIIKHYKNPTAVQNRARPEQKPGSVNSMFFRPRPISVDGSRVGPVPQVSNVFETTEENTTQPPTQPQPQIITSDDDADYYMNNNDDDNKNNIDENELLQSIAKHLRSRPETTNDIPGGGQMTFHGQNSNSGTGNDLSSRDFRPKSRGDDYSRSQQALLQLLKG